MSTYPRYYEVRFAASPSAHFTVVQRDERLGLSRPIGKYNLKHHAEAVAAVLNQFAGNEYSHSTTHDPGQVTAHTATPHMQGPCCNCTCPDCLDAQRKCICVECECPEAVRARCEATVTVPSKGTYLVRDGVVYPVCDDPLSEL